MSTAIACTALLGMLLFGLGLNVSLLRQSRRILIGHPDDPSDPLYRAVRAHANTAEYVPMLAVIILWLGAHEPPPWVLGTIVTVTLARFALAAGLLGWPTMGRPNPARFLGALLTYVGGIVLAAAMLLTR
ncbi:MAG TPA: MAPEG family protein [Burkholderiaceae bacterium]|nr:MAPEG family protein [Burkholderiaceae bacterium]